MEAAGFQELFNLLDVPMFLSHDYLKINWPKTKTQALNQSTFRRIRSLNIRLRVTRDFVQSCLRKLTHKLNTIYEFMGPSPMYCFVSYAGYFKLCGIGKK